MAIKIKSIKESVENQGLKILVYGPAGAGKTMLCATTGERTLIVSAEAGLLSIRDAPDNIEVVTVNTISDVIEVYEMLTETEEVTDEFDEVSTIIKLKDGCPYKWLALDSISEIAEVLLSEEKAKEKDPRKAYMTLQDELTKLLRAFRDLPGLNVIMTAKITRMADDYTGITSYLPSMPGNALKQNVAYLFDEVFVIRVLKDEDGNDIRALQTGLDTSYEGKDRSGKLEPFEKANLKHITNKILGE